MMITTMMPTIPSPPSAASMLPPFPIPGAATPPLVPCRRRSHSERPYPALSHAGRASRDARAGKVRKAVPAALDRRLPSPPALLEGSGAPLIRGWTAPVKPPPPLPPDPAMNAVEGGNRSIARLARRGSGVPRHSHEVDAGLLEHHPVDLTHLLGGHGESPRERDRPQGGHAGIMLRVSGDHPGRCSGLSMSGTGV
jgi:hypothetical protein